MDNKKNGIPKLRFPGFTGAWEQRKLGEVAHIETGKLDANAMVENGKYDFYTSGIKKYRIDIPAFKGPAITIAGNGATVGYMHLADGEFNAYQRTYVLTKFLANRHFIFSEIGNKLPRKIQQESRAGNIPYIVMDMLTDLQLFLPSIAEQEKVGELLNKLNSLITLHQRKLEHLQEQKKGLLQKMFPKNGEVVPEVRFPGFTDAWEQRKFFDNIEKVIDFRGRTPKKLGMEWSAEGYTALSALNVKDGYIDFTADVHYANQDLYDKWMAGNELYKGQVLFTTEAPMGNVAQVPDNRKYVLSQRTIAFNVDKTKVTNDFLAVLLRSQNVQHTLKSLASGGTAQGVSQKSLSQLKVILPINPKEQQEIGNFFNHFDSLITLHQRKLEHLELMKKGLLQQMFV